MVQKAGVLHILTYECASRHSGVAFLDITPSKSGPNPSVFLTFWLQNALRATAACHFWTSELPKWLRQWGVLCIFTCKCASRHSRVPFFNIGTSKMAPTPSVFLAFSLANVLRATAACHFSTSELQKWLRECGALCILTCKCASRHSGVPFFTCLPEQLPPHPPL